MSEKGVRLELFIVGRIVILAAFAIFVSGYFDLARAQQPGQKTFASCQEACAALLSAVQQEDQLALLEILGSEATQIISSGDQAEDRNNRRQFVEKYRQMHRLVREPDGSTTLYVGAENWPLPIVLMHKANKWYFDPVASKAEISFRRIGRNELDAIKVCHELVSAQNEYYAEPHDGGVKQFAPRFLSDDGKHNGLYWKISNREPESPVGQLLALANTGDYAKETTKPRPFHGYYYRILNRQGRHASGGAKNYLVDGTMTGGFAFVAYPAEYRSSGVMTFIVNRDGIVYQKDLGPQTAIRAKTLTQYNPDATWKRVE
ncbi:MAG TPA: DUF2950 domain-containing protein [Pyrinomonadaceae bacterium]|nr:DUF2950 domain-containing protein [Pyrinomonadaceae bacterium]